MVSVLYFFCLPAMSSECVPRSEYIFFNFIFLTIPHLFKHHLPYLSFISQQASFISQQACVSSFSIPAVSPDSHLCFDNVIIKLFVRFPIFLYVAEYECGSQCNSPRTKPIPIGHKQKFGTMCAFFQYQV